MTYSPGSELGAVAMPAGQHLSVSRLATHTCLKVWGCETRIPQTGLLRVSPRGSEEHRQRECAQKGQPGLTTSDLLQPGKCTFVLSKGWMDWVQYGCTCPGSSKSLMSHGFKLLTPLNLFSSAITPGG